MGKGQRKTSQTQQNNQWSNNTRPPEWSFPGFQDSTKEANRLYHERQGSFPPGLNSGTVKAINGLGDMPAQWGNPSGAESNLGSYANGSMIGNNQNFQKALQNQLGNVASTIHSQFAGAGRYGSGAHSAVLGRELGNISTNALAHQYNQDVENQFRANQHIDHAKYNRLSGQEAAWGNALSASGLQDKWNMANDQRAWNELGQWQNAISRGTGGASESSGMSNTSGFNNQKQSKNPWATAGAALGGIGGFMGKSDIRAKENIEFIGIDQGHRIYEFHYKGKPERYRGVMAQDILITNPEAVSVDPADGLYCVDYAKIGLEMKKVQ